MGSGSKTTYLGLSQFGDNDKPTWRGDYNNDMQTIDKASLHRLTPQMFGAKGDGVNDDTSAFNSAITFLLNKSGGTIYCPAGIYAISSQLQFIHPTNGNSVTIVGDGQDATIFKAIGASAELAWGVMPTGPGTPTPGYPGRPGTNRDFKFDGNGIAVKGITVGVGCAYAVWQCIDVTHVSGDGWHVAPQNSTFNACIGRGCKNNGWTLNYGIQSCVFINIHGESSDGWGIEIRQDGGYGWGASAQPQALSFINGIVEQGGSPYYAHTGLGGVHIREGLDITFDRFDLVDSAGDGALVLTPAVPGSTTPGYGTNGYVGRITLRDSIATRIHLKANDASGNARPMGGAGIVLLLTGNGYVSDLTNGSTNLIYDDQMNRATYHPEGVGAPPATTQFIFNTAATPTESPIIILGQGAQTAPLIIAQSSTGQTADLFQTRNSNGGVQCAALESGNFVAGGLGASSQVEIGIGSGGLPAIMFGAASSTRLLALSDALLFTDGLEIQPPVNNSYALTLKGSAGTPVQSVNLLVVEDNSGNVLSAIGPEGEFKLPKFATSVRPSASAVGSGTIIYDSTLALPIYSDGSNWKNFAGTTV